MNLNNISKKILANVKKEFSDNIKCELIESMIEINTNICSNAEEVEKDIKKTLTYIVNDNCIKCKLMDCMEVCPVDCFYEGENMLAIKPNECIDCTGYTY